MPNAHTTKLLCPICAVIMLQHVHCRFIRCSFLITTCPACDREQAVRAFISDHEDDCDCREQSQPFLRRVA